MYSNKRWIFIRRNGSSDKSRPRATRACKSTTSPSRLTPFIVGHCKRHPRSPSMVIRRDNGVHQETCHENGISLRERERGEGLKNNGGPLRDASTAKPRAFPRTRNGMLGFAPALSPTAAEIIKIRQEGIEEADVSAWGEGTARERERVAPFSRLYHLRNRSFPLIARIFYPISNFL